MIKKDESTKTPPDKKKPTDCEHCEIQREEGWLPKKKGIDGHKCPFSRHQNMSFKVTAWSPKKL